MDAFTHYRYPQFADAIGEPVHHWLRRHNAFTQIMDQDFAELPIDPAYLEFHAPQIYAGLEHIVAHPYWERYKISMVRPDETGEDMESGLMARRDDESKSLIHWFQGIATLWRMQGADVDALGEMESSVAELDSTAARITCELAYFFDAQNALSQDPYAGSLTMRFANGLRTTRLLDYLAHNNRAEAPDAKAHNDRSGMTIHWESTHQGLVLWDRHGKKVQTDETNRGKVLIFPGRKVGIVAGPGRAWYPSLGTIHGVRDVDRSTRKSGNRRAIVSFTHPTLTPDDVTYFQANAKKFKLSAADYPL